MDVEGSGLTENVEAFLAEANARREASREPEGVTGYQEGDPRLALSELQFLALRPAAEGKGVNEIAAELGCSPERVKRFFLTSRFRRALAKELKNPTDLGFMIRARLIGPAEASDLKPDALSAGGGRALTDGRNDDTAT